jgi:chromate transporter
MQNPKLALHSNQDIKQIMEIFLYFFRLGCVGFGGPLALISQMQKDLVTERKWIQEEEFGQIFGLIKAMPGPVAFQMAVFFGYRRRGFWGALLAGFALIFPAFVALVLIAHFYQNFSEVSWMRTLMKGMGLGAFALIVWALRSLMLGFSKKWFFWVLFFAGLLISFGTNLPEPALILLFGGVAVLADRTKSSKLAVFDPNLLTIGWICLKAGAFVFGTGLAIVPFLESDFVSRLHWLDHEQFMDAIAFGQLTPGPVTLSVAFISYKVSGLLGATVATIGIFLPAFFHQVTWFPRMQGWLSRQSWINAFTLGVTAAVCSSIALTMTHLGKGWRTTEISVVAALLVLMSVTKVPSWAVILIGGAVAWGLGL